MDSDLLSIVIPTYNRPNQLAKCVAKLLPQLRDTGVQLVILDNASNVPAASVITPLLKDDDPERVTIIRHPANIGGDANVLRSFEMSSSRWVWIVGDDDEPADQAIQTILAAIKQHANAVVINFNSGLLKHFGVTRTETRPLSNLQELGQQLDSFGNFLLISANVYRREAIFPWLQVGYFQIPTCGPHVSMVLAAIQAGSGGAVLHADYIVHWENAAPGEHWGYDRVSFALPHAFSVVADGNIRLQLAALEKKDHPKRPLKRSWLRLLRFGALYASPNRNPAFVLDVFLARLRSHLLSGESVVVVCLVTIVHCLYAVLSPVMRLVCAVFRPICRFSTKGIEKKAPQDAVIALLTDDRI